MLVALFGCTIQLTVDIVQPLVMQNPLNIAELEQISKANFCPKPASDALPCS